MSVVQERRGHLGNAGCKDTINGNWVLIENQLERTDHGHLGQLLTYAAGLKAATIVWIAARFTDEHRAALDWLNDITDDRFNFFALEIELWRIGDSSVAPKFNTVCKPNDWTRSVTAASRESEAELSDTQLFQKKYWSALRDVLLERQSVVNPQTPPPYSNTNFAIGRSYFHMWASMDTRKKTLSVGVTCAGPDAKAHFRMLSAAKVTIGEDFDEPLDWSLAPEKKSSWISVSIDADPTDDTQWPEQHSWIADKLERFHKAFSSRIKQLDAAEYLGESPAVDSDGTP